MPARELELVSALGFSGRVPGGLVVHPETGDMIYPLGRAIVIKNRKTGKQLFLHGHTGDVTCVALSPDGKLIASGQQTYQGFKVSIILWDYNQARSDPATAMLHEMSPYHITKVQGLSFSASSRFLASIGGQDDNTLAIWKTENGKKRSSSSCAGAICVAFSNRDDLTLVTGGVDHAVRWTLDSQTIAMNNVNINMGTISRTILSATFSLDDKACFLGTQTGDLLEIAIYPPNPMFRQSGPELFQKGITAVKCMPGTSRKELIVLGCGSGDVVVLDRSSLKTIGSAKTTGDVTSIAPFGSSVYAGTSKSSIYKVANVENPSKSAELRSSSHYHGVNDVTFMKGFDGVFITCSKNDIRVWDTDKSQELLRIQVPNVVCTCLAVPNDGRLIISGWEDGKIRAFKPKSGQLEFVIDNAHVDGVTALGVTADSRVIVSGGERGEVRFWDIQTRKMLGSIKDHTKRITSLAISADGHECASSSLDGSCLQFDVRRQKRTNAMFSNTMFSRIRYHPDGEYQLLSCGSDCRVQYWDAQDGTAIRTLDISKEHVESLTLDEDGMTFLCGGNDAVLRLFSYDEGELLATGTGHSGCINAIVVSPNQERIVTVGAEGAIFIWKNLDYRGEGAESKYN